MATVVLQYAGAALGTLVGGPIGGIIGRAAGAVAGSVIDQQVFGGGKRRIEGPRLNDLRVMASEEGAPVPDVYGRMRIAGQVIWATNLEEVVETSTEKTSSKGGSPKSRITEYTYFANFAVGLCEGEADYVGRVWADGKEIDLAAFTHRFYRGTEAQMPDSLITAIEGASAAPAYRGLAYIVFEKMPLAKFGNRVPQLAFEVYRHGNGAAALVRGLTVIPGSTEFGYANTVVTRAGAAGVTESENAHASAIRSDWDVSMDEMQGLCRNLDAASLVVSWFGTDLRCGTCEVKPGVEVAGKNTSPLSWQVNGVARSAAHVVSQVNDGPAYGGTPSDQSVIAAIQDLRARGLKVVFYPFLLMDIAAGNPLPDPYGGASQPPYPWRGRMTASVAPGLPGTPDKTPAAASEMNAFVNGTWGYRRMILHYANLCASAGGVDAFLIGSELRGLTTLRSAAGTFPFVTALQQLAAEVKALLPSTDVSYAADWSEYFGYHPPDGSNDLYFHLDPLWSSPAVSFIGIDNYMPMSDWRDGRAHLDFTSGNRSIYDLEYLMSNMAGGEGFSWFYDSQASRNSQLRTPISDGAYSKPWVYRYKDIRSWWLNPHFNRPGGIESATPTGWQPQSKPVWFTEAGCPAIDKGTNSPNLFYDAKSSESAYPPFSGGQRDDLIQNRYVRALQAYWNASGAHNPVSSVYGRKMLDRSRIFYWTWDSRPFPAFPALSDVWSDGPNYEKGHWLTGRLAAVDLGDLIRAIALKFGFTSVDVNGVEGLVDGFVIDRPMSGRDALEAILQAFSVDSFESGGTLKFVSRRASPDVALNSGALIDVINDPLVDVTRRQETELPRSLQLLYAEAGMDYRNAAVSQSRASAATAREAVIALPAAVTQHLAQARADIMLEEIWAGRETAALALPLQYMALEPGDVLIANDTRRWRISAITDGDVRKITAVRDVPEVYDPASAANRVAPQSRPAVYGPPSVILMDLATVTASSTNAPWIAAFAKPWPGALAVYRKTGDASFAFNRLLEARATLGKTLTNLPRGLVNRLDFSSALDVELSYGALASISQAQLLDGGNAALIGSAATGYEIIQFKFAGLMGSNRYRLNGLLRAQGGSLGEMLAARNAGENFVLFNSAVIQPALATAQQGLLQNWRMGPASKDHADPSYVEVAFDPALLPLRPLAPAQLRATKDTLGITLSWIRQTRIDGDVWETADVPLGETSEAYAIEILAGATVLRSIATTASSFLYAAADILADFGTIPSSLTFRVAQVSAAYGNGTFSQRTINV
jgi:GTA TIM-barrel-like domain/Putative phage tail protein